MTHHTPNGISKILAEHQRICLLRFLAEAPGMDLNESILQDGLTEFALDSSRDNLRTQLAWLNEQQLITLESVGSTQIAKLTERGLDVANGKALVPGVKRPSVV